MPPTPEQEVAWRQWAATAQVYLAAVTNSVDALRQAFEAGPPTDDDAVDQLASDTVSACSGLTEWLTAAHAPRGLRKAEGELSAVAGVCRNAAFAFRSLADAESDQLDARKAACATMLRQGEEHVDLFTTTVRKKLDSLK